MVEKKICTVCNLEKSLDSYYACKNCKNGKLSICKLCKVKGLKVNKDHIIHPFNQMWRRSEESFFSLNRVTKEDYEIMWQLLQDMGYDTSGDIHRQFVDKINSQAKKPVKYRKKTLDTQPKWLANGERNPRNPNKNVSISKKTPTDGEGL